MRTMQQALAVIADAVTRKKAGFDVVPSPEANGSFVLLAGSFRAVKNGRGVLVTMSVSPEQLRELRGLCDELLGEKQ